jgi:hypothetical protein
MIKAYTPYVCRLFIVSSFLSGIVALCCGAWQAAGADLAALASLVGGAGMTVIGGVGLRALHRNPSF